MDKDGNNNKKRGYQDDKLLDEKATNKRSQETEILDEKDRQLLADFFSSANMMGSNSTNET